MAFTHPFDEALTLLPLEREPSPTGREGACSFLGHTHAGYANMIGPFGGTTAAQALNAVLQHPLCLGEPLAFTCNFAVALAEGEFRLEAVPVRTNRSTQHWTVTLFQQDASGAEGVVLTATAVTALRRTTWSAVESVMPAVEPPLTLPRASADPRFEWLARFDMRLCAGGFPHVWDGAEADSVTQVWMRDDPPRPLDFCGLAARADAFYPRVWRRRALMTPAGTVSMTVYFHATASELAATGTGYLLGQAKAQSFFNGFFDQSVELWNEAGQLLATSHQIVYFKE
jgi:acyl-CoA thioesterase